MKANIGFIGLGQLGLPIARNLLQAGHSLKIYNRTPEKAEPLVKEGAILANRVAAAASPGGLLFSCLADDQAVTSLLLQEEVMRQLGKGGIHVSISTISPATSKTLAAHHAQYGVAYVAAPVFGRPQAVAARKGFVCVSGPAAAKEKVQPLLLQAMAQQVFDFGEAPEAANVVKLAGNFLIASAIEAMAEALTLAEKNGIDRNELMQMFTQTLFNCSIYQNYGKMIATEDYATNVGFRLPLGLKDINLVLEAAMNARVPMPLAQVVQQHLLAAVAKGKTTIDWTGFALEVSENAGLQR